MSKEHLHHQPERLNLETINQSLCSVETYWGEINDALEKHGIGRKDKFSTVVRDRLMTAYVYLDELLEQRIEPFPPENVRHLFALNNKVHYGNDLGLMQEYSKAIAASLEQFDHRVVPIEKWYINHKKQGDHPLKLASEIYVSILGHPQLFIEGNHRTGNLIANWISVYYGYPLFVLSAENAISYFAPSAEIKYFADKSTWRGKKNLPKYNKSFRKFWEGHIDTRYLKSGG